MITPDTALGSRWSVGRAAVPGRPTPSNLSVLNACLMCVKCFGNALCRVGVPPHARGRGSTFPDPMGWRKGWEDMDRDVMDIVTVKHAVEPD